VAGFGLTALRSVAPNRRVARDPVLQLARRSHPMSTDPPGGRLRAVVFDLDGLIFNTEDLYEQVGSEVLRRRGKTMTDQLLNEMMGRKTPVALQIMIDHHGLDDTVDTLAAETYAIFDTILDEHLRLMPGLAELIDRLDALGIPKAIATSSRRAFARSVLSRFDLEPRFQFVLTAENIEHGKPDPDIYLSCARLFGVEPEEMMVLEDSETGCRAGVGAGAFTVAVPHGRSQTHDFSGVRLVADTLADPRIYRALGIAASDG